MPELPLPCRRNGHPASEGRSFPASLLADSPETEPVEVPVLPAMAMLRLKLHLLAFPIVKTLALGGLTNGVTTYELNAAYAAIANMGTYVEPKLTLKVEPGERRASVARFRVRRPSLIPRPPTMATT